MSATADPSRDRDYVPRVRWGDLAGILALLAAHALGGAFTVVAWVALILWALTGAAAAVRAVLLGMFLSFLNPGLFPVPAWTADARWVLLAAAGCCAGGRWLLQHDWRRLGAREYRLLSGMLVFGATTLVLSLYASAFPLLSLFKLGGFILAFATIALGLLASEQFPWRDWLWTFALLLVLGGLPLIATPYGFLRNGVAFQGLLSQPQAYGVLLGGLMGYFTVLAATRATGSLLLWSLVIAGWASAYLSRSRTALFALAGALGLSFAAMLLARADVRRHLARHFSHPLRAAGAVYGVAGMLALLAPLTATLTGFALKDVDRDSGVQGVLESRSVVVARELENFENHPMTGIGFGVPSSPEDLAVTRDASIPWLPVSAPVEKGNLATAVLEETGLLGALAFLYFLFTLFGPILRQGTQEAFALAAGAVLVNMGEMVFFSPGGLGIFVSFFLLLAWRERAVAPVASPGLELEPYAPSAPAAGAVPGGSPGWS